jgi:NADH-quinone oxidoreductase subunit M
MGFVMLGISTLTPIGINAALFGMVAHGLITGMLFFVAGSVKERYHTLEIRRLSGMLLQMPKLGWILGFCAMASLGLPGLAGFWGEFPAILSAYNPMQDSPWGSLSVPLFRTLMVIAALGTVLAAAYLLWLYQRTAFGNVSPEFDHLHNRPAHSVGAAVNTGNRGGAHDMSLGGHDIDHTTSTERGEHDHGHDDIHDVTIYEWIAWLPLLIAIVVLGVYPQLMFRVMDPAVTQLVGVFDK